MPTATYRATAFVEAARRLGLDLTVASEHPSALERAQPDALLTLDFTHPERAAEQARAFAARRPVDAVLGVDDDTVVLAAVIGAALGHGVNPVAALEAARDKHRQRRLLREHGLPVPNFRLERIDANPEQFASSITYPCVVKPLRLAASRGVMRVDDPARLAEAVRRLRAILAEPDAARCGEPARAYLIEDFIPGVEVALEAILEHGQLRPLALFDKPDPLNGPFFEETIYLTPSRLPQAAQAELVTIAGQAAAALGLRIGPVHAELRWNERGGWLIELAARPIGGRCSAVLRFQDGRSLEEIVIAQAVGQAFGAPQREPRAAGVMMIPVPGAGVVRAISGVEDAREVSGIDDVVVTTHLGQRLVPWPEGSRYPGFLFARGDSPEAVERALREAHRRLRFQLDPV